MFRNGSAATGLKQRWPGPKSSKVNDRKSKPKNRLLGWQGKKRVGGKNPSERASRKELTGQTGIETRDLRPNTWYLRKSWQNKDEKTKNSERGRRAWGMRKYAKQLLPHCMRVKHCFATKTTKQRVKGGCPDWLWLLIIKAWQGLGLGRVRVRAYFTEIQLHCFSSINVAHIYLIWSWY